MNRNLLVKAGLFLLLATIIELLFRNGILRSFLPPLGIPNHLQVLIWYSLYALGLIFLTKSFVSKENSTLTHYGINLSKLNRRDFLIGLGISILLWGLMSYAVSLYSGIEWRLHLDNLGYNLAMGLFFIFVADLGTELQVRGFALTKLNKALGLFSAIVVIMLYVGAKSYLSHANSSLAIYAMIIPAIHVIFFSVIYLRTKRLGGALGVHTGANFVTNSIFDFDGISNEQVIMPGLFQLNSNLTEAQLASIQVGFITIAIVFTILVFRFLKPNSHIS